MWNAVSRYLEDLAGFEKPEYDSWGYTGDGVVWEEITDE